MKSEMRGIVQMALASRVASTISSMRGRKADREGGGTKSLLLPCGCETHVLQKAQDSDSDCTWIVQLYDAVPA